MAAPPPRLLEPELLAHLQRLRMATRRRVQGRFAGGHTSRRFGSSLDFADHREYVAGDDPRRIDHAAYQRLGRLLVKLFEAEDEAAVRVVVDLSASMGFGDKPLAARRVAALFAALAANGQDRIRLLLATPAGVEPGPWYRGPATVVAAEARLMAAVTADPTAPGDDHRSPDLLGALRRAHGEGPAGPVILISDLLFEGWDVVLGALASGRGDPILVHLLGTSDLEPDVRGDVRLVDSETGAELEVGVAEEVLAAYAATRDAWLDEVQALCGRKGIASAVVTDATDLRELVGTTLRRLGVVA